MTTLAFVEAPAAVPVVKLSLHTWPSVTVPVESFTLGGLTFDGDAGSVGAEDGEREASFTVQVVGTSAAAGATIRDISRQLLAARNWLMVQPGNAAEPYFLHTYRTAQDALQWEDDESGIWQLPVRLSCDPGISGPPETLGPYVIQNNPAAATKPCFHKTTVNAVKGDFPAPVTVKMVPSVNLGGRRLLMSMVAMDPAPAGPVVWQVNTAGFTAGVDTTKSTTDASMSNGTRATVTFATDAGMKARLYGTAPATLVPGRYKVLVRAARTTGGTETKMRLKQASPDGDQFYEGPVVRFNLGASWVDLGEFTFPFGVGDVDPADVGNVEAPNVTLMASRTAGAGDLLIDCFLLVPVDTAATVERAQTLRVAFSGVGPGSTNTAVVDSANKRYRQYVTTGNVLTAQFPPQMPGGFPVLVPGKVNVAHLLQQTFTEAPLPGPAQNDSLTATTSVTFEYVPQYLHLRPDGG